MENLTKENVFIRVNTEKKARKLKKVLDMFGEETMSKNTLEIVLKEYGLIKFDCEVWYSCSMVYGLTEVTIKQLKQILAKEKEPRKDLEVGKWYFVDRGDLSENRSLVYFQGHGIDTYGFDHNGNWTNNYGNAGTFKNPRYKYTEAKPQEVEDALTKEVEKRYKVGDCIECLSSLKDIGEVKFTSIKYYHEDCELWIGNPRNMICIFKNGKWASVISAIKPEEKPQIGDVVAIYQDGVFKTVRFFNHRDEIRNNDAITYKVVSKQEVNDLLFKN